MAAYPWYEILKRNSELHQGDFIPECPIIKPPTNIKEGELLDLNVTLIDSIILSQSCDLVNNKVENVLVCPFFSLKEFIEGLSPEQKSPKGLKKVLENLKKGQLPAYHLLEKNLDNDKLGDYQVVDFRNVYGINFEALRALAQNMEERVRLLPPYKEHLSQAFARYFMRVGLPNDINIQGY